MATLRSLLANRAPLLILDAASNRVQVGVLESDGRHRWITSDEEAGIALFRSVEALGIDPLKVGGYVYCSGPGSILGIRTCAMALRTWRALTPIPVWSYCSLEVLAEAQRPRRIVALADARRDSWHVFETGGSLRRLPSAALDPASAYVTPEGFRTWSPLPAGILPEMLPYRLESLWEALSDTDLLRADEAPDAFLHEDPSYATWTPQVHRAPHAP